MRNPYIHKAILALVTGSLITAGLIWLIFSANIVGFEEQILLLFRHTSDLANPLGSSFVEEAIRDLTALGGTLVTTLITLFAVIFLFLVQKPRQAMFLALAVLLGVAYLFLIKLGFDRPRPDIVPHDMRSLSPSFPSGHSATSAIVYFLVAGVISRGFANRPLKIFVFSFAALITVSVGISRVYLGVHWPTDVVGGWIVGTTWVLTCWMVEKALIEKKVLSGRH